MTENSVEDLERRARKAEESSLPVFLKFGRAMVLAIYVMIVAVVIILGVAFVLRLFGASTDAPFTRWVYRNSESSMRPFRGIFPTKELGAASVFDAALICGAIVYACIAMAFDAAIFWLRRRIETTERDTQTARAQADAVRVRFEALERTRDAQDQQRRQPEPIPGYASPPQ
jgi:uncharacterized protein YggT (Ycf19 family)